MTLGLAATTLANKWLDMLRAVAFTAPANVYAQLHTADPGAAGTTSVFANVATARSAITWSAAAANGAVQQIAISNTPTWTVNGAGGTVTHLALFDATSAGNFLWSMILGSSKAVVATDVLNLTSCTLSLTPIAA